MEQLSLFDYSEDWISRTKQLLQQMIEELELPNNSLYLREEYGKKTGKLTSRSICIYEPEYPPIFKASEDPNRNAVVLRITEKHLVKEGDYLEITVSNENQIGDIQTPSDAIEMSNTLRFRPDSSSLIQYFRASILYALSNYQSKASSFGCCSNFMKCSDAKKCVHENKLYSKACIYRTHLDNGEIFYGKNKNV